MYLLPLIFSLLSMFSLATFWTPTVSASEPSARQNDPSIVNRSDAYLNAIVAGDAGAVAAMFEDNAILMPPNQPSLSGRLAIQHFYEGWCHSPGKPTAFTFDHVEATVSGDSAYDVGTYKLTMLVGPGRNVHDSGKYSVILKRSANGWKITYLIFNSDLPPQPQLAGTAN
jgi:ketosteroid isomerase-like protein